MNDWQVHEFNVEEYLAAVGLGREEPGLDYLGRLHEAHVATFPFTNVDVLLGRHPGVAPATVGDRLLRRGTGGYCLEQVQLFAGVLEQLGFTVRRRFGRARSPENPRSHLTDAVTLGDTEYLCDPGFGFSIQRPLPFLDGAVLTRGGRTFTLRSVGEGPGQVWQFSRDGVFQHQVDLLPVQPVDVATCHAFLGSGFGPFTTSLMATRFIPGGHITVTHHSRTVRMDGAETVFEELAPAQVVEAVGELGVDLGEGKAEALREKGRELQAGGRRGPG